MLVVTVLSNVSDVDVLLTLVCYRMGVYLQCTYTCLLHKLYSAGPGHVVLIGSQGDESSHKWTTRKLIDHRMMRQKWCQHLSLRIPDSALCKLQALGADCLEFSIVRHGLHGAATYANADVRSESKQFSAWDSTGYAARQSVYTQLLGRCGCWEPASVGIPDHSASASRGLPVLGIPEHTHQISEGHNAAWLEIVVEYPNVVKALWGE
jgi:hypothetical protein